MTDSYDARIYALPEVSTMSPSPYEPVRRNARPGVNYLTPKEVAKELRVSNMTVYRLISSGDLFAHRIGRSFRVPEKAVDDYLRGPGMDWTAEA